MESHFPNKLLARLERTGVMAVLVIDNVKAAVPVARALLEGGIEVAEVTLRTDAAIAALSAICHEVPEMLAVAGTVLTPDQVDRAIDAGAAFAVAPGLNLKTVEHAIDRGLPFAPGVITPTDIEAAITLGCRTLKFFPAEAAGGLGLLGSLQAPYRHLGLRFLPTGGIATEQLADYLACPATLSVGGSWIATAELIASEDWQAISARASEAQRIVTAVRGGK
jgi:2-dehydro-3-deoxyphosphogluconate aldolase/(4S)-4-hydroxy-2-oxoglutarate aldolase